MSEPMPHFSPETFDRIFSLLTSDTQFRERFYADPEQAVRDVGISLTPEECDALRSVKPCRDVKEMETFDERLVLTSSSGY